MPHANAGCLGLLAFGMPTTLLSLHNLGIFPLTSMILGIGVVFGGIGQIIAGCFEMVQGSTFNGAVFTSYGCFWLSLCIAWVCPEWGEVKMAEPTGMCFYLFIWAILTFAMYFHVRRINIALNVIFGSLTSVLFLLSMANAVKAGGCLFVADIEYSFLVSDADAAAIISGVAGFLGLVAGLTAFYTGIAEILNEDKPARPLPLGSRKPAVLPVADAPAIAFTQHDSV